MAQIKKCYYIGRMDANSKFVNVTECFEDTSTVLITFIDKLRIIEY